MAIYSTRHGLCSQECPSCRREEQIDAEPVECYVPGWRGCGGLWGHRRVVADSNWGGLVKFWWTVLLLSFAGWVETVQEEGFFTGTRWSPRAEESSANPWTWMAKQYHLAFVSMEGTFHISFHCKCREQSRAIVTIPMLMSPTEITAVSILY